MGTPSFSNKGACICNDGGAGMLFCLPVLLGRYDGAILTYCQVKDSVLLERLTVMISSKATKILTPVLIIAVKVGVLVVRFFCRNLDHEKI